jgi:hypothetical protein
LERQYSAETVEVVCERKQEDEDMEKERRSAVKLMTWRFGCVRLPSIISPPDGFYRR